MKMYLPPPRARKSRRSFLKKGLFGGLLLTLGGSSWLFTRRSAPALVPEGIQVLNAAEYAVMWSVVQCFAPAREGFPSPDSLQAASACDGILAQLEPVTQLEVKRLLMLFENALPNFIFGGRTQPFSQMAPSEQHTVLSEWRHSRLAIRRTGYLALRGLAMASYYGNPLTWASLGYPGPPSALCDPSAPVWKGPGEVTP